MERFFTETCFASHTARVARRDYPGVSHIDARAIDYELDNSRNITVVSGTSEHADHLVVLYYNARSIVSTFDKLNVTVRLKQPNIVCIVETWLSSDILDKEIHLPGYQLLRLDRNRHGGGILLYVHEMMSYKLLVRGGPFNLEFISISVTSSIIQSSFCMCLFYRPPSSSVIW